MSKFYDIQRLRNQFPFFQSNAPIYLDNAATTQKPACVIEATQQFYTYSNSNVHRSSSLLAVRTTTQYEEARKTVAAFVNAPSWKNIIFTRGATESINLVAECYLRDHIIEGGEVLISAQEHHANILPWQRVVKRANARIKVIPLLDDGQLDLVAFKNLLNEKTCFVALTHIGNALGTLMPIEECAKLAREKNIPILIDGAQAALHVTIDVKAIDCDFYVFSAHKCLGPTGVGILYAKESMQAQMSPWLLGGEMVEDVSFDRFDSRSPPYKFEAGTQNIAGIIAFQQAIQFLQQQDRALLEQYENTLLKYFVEKLQGIDGVMLVKFNSQSRNILSLRFDKAHISDIGNFLSQKHISARVGHHCAKPLMKYLGVEGTLRFSLCFYNTESDIDAAVETIKLALEKATCVPPATNTAILFSQLKKKHSREKQFQLLTKISRLTDNTAPDIRNDSNRVKGCESQVWLELTGTHDHCQIVIDSDARLIKGIGVVISHELAGKSLNELKKFDYQQLLDTYHLKDYLSPSRVSGIHSIIEKIQALTEQPS